MKVAELNNHPKIKCILADKAAVKEIGDIIIYYTQQVLEYWQIGDNSNFPDGFDLFKEYEKQDWLNQNAELVHTYDTKSDAEFKQWMADYNAETQTNIQSRYNEIIEQIKVA